MAVKTVYFGKVDDSKNISLNEMRKCQSTKFTSNDLRKITPSSGVFNKHPLPL